MAASSMNMVFLTTAIYNVTQASIIDARKKRRFRWKLTRKLYLQEMVPLPFKVAVVVLFIVAGVLVLGPCFVGKQFHDVVRFDYYNSDRRFVFYTTLFCNFQNEIMMHAVYNTPWYYLPKMERKQIHLFLCEVQHSPTKFTGFLVYPIDTMTFPKMLSFYYKIASVMRTFYSRTKNK